MPENTGQIQKKGRFKKGESGNPKGKPKGAKHRASLLAEKLFENDIEMVCNQVISQAREGNLQAAKIILDRLLPPRKDRLINIELPPVNDSSDALKALKMICFSVGNGEISPLEGEALSKIIEIQAKSIELYDFEKRLQAIEDGAMRK
jgi:hypothetical protein